METDTCTVCEKQINKRGMWRHMKTHEELENKLSAIDS